MSADFLAIMIAAALVLARDHRRASPGVHVRGLRAERDGGMRLARIKSGRGFSTLRLGHHFLGEGVVYCDLEGRAGDEGAGDQAGQQAVVALAG